MVVPRRSYLVCATPRSGSTLLCETLERRASRGARVSTSRRSRRRGLPRRPREYFWGLRSPEVIRLLPHDAQHRSDRPNGRRRGAARTTDAIWTGPLREGTTRQRGVRREDDVGLLQRLPRARTGHPPLRRHGRRLAAQRGLPGRALRVHLAQRQGAPGGIAVAGAADVGLAQGGGRIPADEPLPAQRAVYSFDAIDHLLDQLRRHEDAWRGLLLPDRPATPLDRLRGRRRRPATGSVARVLADVGRRASRRISVASARGPSRQSDDLSESWVQNYLEDVSRR